MNISTSVHIHEDTKIKSYSVNDAHWLHIGDSHPSLSIFFSNNEQIDDVIDALEKLKIKMMESDK